MAASTTLRLFARVLAAYALLGFSSSPSVAQPKLLVRFGIVMVGPAGQAQFVETTRVPNVVGQIYGWTATLEPTAAAIDWSEELRLPKSPVTWPRDGVAVSEDRTVALTRGRIAAGQGEFSRFWAVAPGDPNGTYSVVVKMFDGVVADFNFEVVPQR